MELAAGSDQQQSVYFVNTLDEQTPKYFFTSAAQPSLLSNTDTLVPQIIGSVCLQKPNSMEPVGEISSPLVPQIIGLKQSKSIEGDIGSPEPIAKRARRDTIGSMSTASVEDDADSVGGETDQDRISGRGQQSSAPPSYYLKPSIQSISGSSVWSSDHISRSDQGSFWIISGVVSVFSDSNMIFSYQMICHCW